MKFDIYLYFIKKFIFIIINREMNKKIKEFEGKIKLENNLI